MEIILILLLIIDILFIILLYWSASEDIEKSIDSYAEKGWTELGIGDSSIMYFLKKNKKAIQIVATIFFPIWFVCEAGLALGTTIFENKTKDNFDKRLATYFK